MNTFNLLPWRQQLKTKQKQRFLGFLTTLFLLIISLIVLCHLYYDCQIAKKNYRIQILTAKLSAINKQCLLNKQKTAKLNLINKKIAALDSYTSKSEKAIYFFYELEKVLPESIVLTEIKFNAGEILLSGAAFNELQITSFLQNMQASRVFQRPVLQEVKNNLINDDESYFALKTLLS